MTNGIDKYEEHAGFEEPITEPDGDERHDMQRQQKLDEDTRVCYAPGDRCLACPHYYGKTDECKYKPKYFDLSLSYRISRTIEGLVRHNAYDKQDLIQLLKDCQRELE